MANVLCHFKNRLHVRNSSWERDSLSDRHHHVLLRMVLDHVSSDAHVQNLAPIARRRQEVLRTMERVSCAQPLAQFQERGAPRFDGSPAHHHEDSPQICKRRRAPPRCAKRCENSSTSICATCAFITKSWMWRRTGWDLLTTSRRMRSFLTSQPNAARALRALRPVSPQRCGDQDRWAEDETFHARKFHRSLQVPAQDSRVFEYLVHRGCRYAARHVNVAVCGDEHNRPAQRPRRNNTIRETTTSSPANVPAVLNHTTPCAPLYTRCRYVVETGRCKPSRAK